MKDEARREARSDNIDRFETSTGSGEHYREHELDRMVAVATWRHKQAKAGSGFKFDLPQSLRVGA